MEVVVVRGMPSPLLRRKHTSAFTPHLSQTETSCGQDGGQAGQEEAGHGGPGQPAGGAGGVLRQRQEVRGY